MEDEEQNSRETITINLDDICSITVLWDIKQCCPHMIGSDLFYLKLDRILHSESSEVDSRSMTVKIGFKTKKRFTDSRRGRDFLAEYRGGFLVIYLTASIHSTRLSMF